MARKALELAGIAAAKLQTAKNEIIAAGDPETISWALDRFREVEEMLRGVVAYDDTSPGEVEAKSEAA
ncbi:hypothetical protein SAMN06265338_1184 [Rhodoblastus acidophilus]|uniref:Uncharacterized protein n=1 Tax=Rhodoblastus acidophilus TaxID=1074 RepID=A0A212S9G6_RHOAC|nr:hypothetical protein [Rhodoblastus acidophilus]PPQ36077.1 hypothetical protein CKO16_19040 [Rhodoblastus acidophilus]RAI18776.1 hypothetical protein CH337_13505 [Rhodoblastus acidophilus]SNB82095.1 hypothetical protein SAMN06265338_1184 [Rhodoblastus acidophilus]